MSSICSVMGNPKYEREVRVRLGRVWDEAITNLEMSEETDIPLNTISKYKNGASINQITTIWRMCEYLSDRLGRKIYIEDVLEAIEFKPVASPNTDRKK